MSILTISGCETNNSEKCNCSNENTFEVVDAKGTVYFDKDVQKWFISVPQDGTIDNVQLFFPCDLEDSYKTPDKKVILSGTASDLSLEITVPAGTQYSCIEISSINNLN